MRRVFSGSVARCEFQKKERYKQRIFSCSAEHGKMLFKGGKKNEFVDELKVGEYYSRSLQNGFTPKL